jgi:uncharacterized protein YbaR (Trm112 family)
MASLLRIVRQPVTAADLVVVPQVESEATAQTHPGSLVGHHFRSHYPVADGQVPLGRTLRTVLAMYDRTGR